jgi:hypothetical protein
VGAGVPARGAKRTAAVPPPQGRAGGCGRAPCRRRVEGQTSVAPETAVLGLATRRIIRADEIEYGVAGYLA